MTKAPNKWIAGLLAFFFQPIGLLYAGRPLAALLYLAVPLLVLFSVFFFAHAYYPMVGALFWILPVAGSIHAYRAAKRHSGGERRWYGRWYGLIGVWLGILLAIFLFRSFLYEPFHLPANSMAPDLPRAAHVVVQKWGYGHYGSFGIPPLRTAPTRALERGDVIVFEYPRDRSLNYIKRVIGLPGDHISYKAGRININGREAVLQHVGFYESEIASGPVYTEKLDTAQYRVLHIEESPVYGLMKGSPLLQLCTSEGNNFECTVPAGHYFVLGDNRNNSVDSRVWGYVPTAHVVGKVIKVLP